MKNFTVFPFLICMFALTVPKTTWGQAFTKVTDPNNPIVSFVPPGGNFPGCAWVDFDGDGDLDLSVTPRYLFRNDGNDTFTDVSGNFGSNQSSQLGNGLSWGDYDNDGDMDVYLAGNPSSLYENTGNNTFSLVVGGDLGAINNFRDWNCAWGDYDNDGWLDLVAAHPAGFLGPTQGCHLFHNDGSGDFTRVDSFGFNQTFFPYTVATWSDFDDDGDADLFVASGPGGSPGLDQLYENKLDGGSVPDFEKMQNPPMAMDQQDGQTWNWVDVDNDGDLDGFITNWGGAPNRFYLNDSGVYKSQVNPLVISENSLANLWGDYDNDGDEDVIITNQSSLTHYFQNDGNGGFVELTIALTQNVFTCGATAGDYDNDGDLDVFFAGNFPGKALWKNENPFANHWINIRCWGTASNRAAIGTKVKLKANIGGKDVWQRREISAQNSFCSHSSLRVHFGLGDATLIDSLELIWPSGLTEYYTQLPVDTFLVMTEGIQTPVDPALETPVSRLLPNFPNPFGTTTRLAFEMGQAGSAKIGVFDLSGKKIQEVAFPHLSSGKHFWTWDGADSNGIQVSSGIYLYSLETAEGTQWRKMAKAQ